MRSWLEDDATVAAVVDGIGAGLTGLLVDAFDKPNQYGNMRDEATLLRILWALSAIPTDEAFTALVERRHVKSALPAVLHAMHHYQRRDRERTRLTASH